MKKTPIPTKHPLLSLTRCVGGIEPSIGRFFFDVGFRVASMVGIGERNVFIIGIFKVHNNIYTPEV